MVTAPDHRPVQIDRFFAGPGARSDQWRNLVEVAEAWSNGSGSRAKFDLAFSEMSATEEFHAYPGPQLMTALRNHAAENDRRRRRRLPAGSPEPC